MIVLYSIESFQGVSGSFEITFVLQTNEATICLIKSFEKSSQSSLNERA